MQSAGAASGSTIDRCSRCALFGPGIQWSFGYGKPVRISQRTGEDVDGYIGSDAVFLCAACQRRLLWSALRQFVKKHPHTIVLPLASIPISFALYGWFPGIILNERVFVALASAAIGCAYVAWRWSRRHALTMQRLCFEVRRRELAAKSNLSEGLLVYYTPR